MNLFSCDDSKLVGTDATCTITDISGVSFPEYVYCSNRGICDFTTGKCSCYEDFYGGNCETYAPLSSTSQVIEAGTSDVLQVQVHSKTFTSDLVKLSSVDSASNAFTFIKLNDNYRNIFVIDGAGNILVNYGEFNIHRGGLTITSGGLKVSGGLTVHQHGISSVGGMTVNNHGLKIYQHGLSVEGGMTIVTSGLKLTGGLTIESGLANIDAGDISYSVSSYRDIVGCINDGILKPLGKIYCSTIFFRNDGSITPQIQ